MTIDYLKLKNLQFADVARTYTAQDTILYALGIGFGSDPTSAPDLRYLLEDRLIAFPTQATVLGLTPGWLADPELGVDYLKVLHGEQRLTLHRPLPAQGTVKCKTRVVEVIDKGEGRGAIVINERVLYETPGDARLATVITSSFCRANGGFGGPVRRGHDPHPLPEEDPQEVEDYVSSRRSALIYRLSGDLNPIHADPEVARRAGFKEPIMHGLCTYAIAGRAVVAKYCNQDPTRLRSLDVRFSAPAYPGETLRVELWRSGRIVSFRMRALERNVLILNNGRAEFDP
jgi:acyl dehydratase